VGDRSLLPTHKELSEVVVRLEPMVVWMFLLPSLKKVGPRYLTATVPPYFSPHKPGHLVGAFFRSTALPGNKLPLEITVE
jgi:hypothetical protein